MPSLSKNTESFGLNVRSYLQSALPESQLTEAQVAPSYHPLLLLQTDHLLAAFAFSKSDVRQCYETVYGGFKNYFVEQRGVWDKLDVAFIFCVLPDFSHLDDFYSIVETDVYFCRKFVVSLVDPLSAALSRLPFLPLTPLHGQSLRPPSAQSFLHQCGVPASLAKYLVVQRERGPQKIVEDCLNGDFGAPTQLMPTSNLSTAQLDQSTEPITVESMTIENFRAYKKPQTFNFGTDVTVLYGPNGFGKTSFFDAFDFVATGEIGRIKSSGDEDFKELAKHLDSKPEDSSVSLSFLCNGARRTITRTVGDRKFANLDNIRRDRKAVLTELTAGQFPAADRVENFVSLFRATHLFNQEHPELTKDFQDDCRLPSDIVARMLAFEDYANAVGKTTKVKELIDRTIEEAKSQIKELTEQINNEREDLARLSKMANESLRNDMLDKELQSLRKAVEALGIFVESEKIDAAMVRGWRASLEARLIDSKSQSDRLAELVNDLAIMPQNRAEIARLQQQIAEKDQALSNLELKRISALAESQTAEEHVAEIGRSIADAQAQVDVIEWARATRPEYTKSVEQQRLSSELLNRSIDSFSHDRFTEEQLAAELSKHDDLAKQKSKLLKIKHDELVAANTLISSLKVLLASHSRLKILDETEETAVELFNSLRAEATELSLKSDELAAEEDRISIEVRELEETQSVLKNLVSQLLEHVHTGTCPLCGDDHGSRDELLDRIQTHGSVDVSAGARSRLNNMRELVKQLTQRTSDNTQKQRAVEDQLRDLSKEREMLNTDISRIVNSAEQIGILIDSSNDESARQLQSFIERLQLEISQLEQQLNEINTQAAETRKALETLRDVIADKAVDLNEQQLALKRVQNQVIAFRDDPRAIQVAFELHDEEFSKLDRSARSKLSESRTTAMQIQNTATECKSILLACQQESTALKSEVASLRAQLTKLQTELSQFSARLEELKFPPDANEESLHKRIAAEARAQAQVVSIRDTASNMELAIDAATTAAALTQLRENLRNKEKVVASATKARDDNHPWLEYFNDVSNQLSTQQNEAIARLTKEYGPRTSVIQRRLRAVYGFDDVEILSHGSEIRVRVTRNGEVLRPTHYFSQSQQQTLFMGLFLTACISQTWSAFSPVLLDDPVTHFDDLNTYAFLDLVVGLLEPYPRKRQFVISTCDEKLLQLARQKFRHLGERAKFYRFIAIGEEGPLVEEI